MCSMVLFTVEAHYIFIWSTYFLYGSVSFYDVITFSNIWS